MNISILCGRLTKDVETKITQSGNSMARYSIAVDRRRKDDQQPTDFFNIVAFGKAADFAANYFHKGMRVLIQGHIQTGSYVNRDGATIPTFDIIADNQEFADGKQDKPKRTYNNDEFMTVPEDAEGIPF